MSELVWKIAMCNIRGMNNPAKQKDIVHWHVESGNMVSIVTEMKLKSGWFLGAGVAIIMNNFLAHCVSKINEISGQIISVCLLFKGKLSVTVLGLYAGVSSGIRFGQAIEVNSFITRALNSNTFVVLSVWPTHLVHTHWSELLCKAIQGVPKKTIDYIFVSDSLSSAVANQIVASVSDYFDTNYKTVMVLVGLGGLLDVHLNECSLVEFSSVVNKVLVASDGGDFDFMWSCLVKVLINSADKMFFRHWFHEIKCFSNKQSSKFFKLELLVAKLVKFLQSGNASRTGSLLNAWLIADECKTLEIRNMLNDGASSEDVFVCLSGLKKSYHCFKMHKAKVVKAVVIRHAIDRRMKNFCTDKGHMIRSILNRLFHKMVLDHLVVDDELVLDPSEVKSKVDVIIEGWTRKQSALTHLFTPWACQYALLQYVDDDAFSGVMDVISFNELF
ncbi:hypothetical protein G9A89_005182 [Geosiphon pyriformis]|nr:hypothetical protein G9A89_005182 [Geosiphon pyriformis]